MRTRSYHQEELSSQDREAGKNTVVTRYKAQKTILVAYDAKEIPLSPPSYLVPEGDIGPRSKKRIRDLRDILVQRPVITRRAAYNKMPEGSLADFTNAIPYVAYSFRSGPWRDAIVSFGVDPREDPKFARYQTIYFQLESKTSERVGNRYYHNYDDASQQDNPSDEHIFDGKKLSTSGSVWQVCDITDPLIKSLLDRGVQGKCEVCAENSSFSTLSSF